MDHWSMNLVQKGVHWFQIKQENYKKTICTSHFIRIVGLWKVGRGLTSLGFNHKHIKVGLSLSLYLNISNTHELNFYLDSQLCFFNIWEISGRASNKIAVKSSIDASKLSPDIFPSSSAWSYALQWRGRGDIWLKMFQNIIMLNFSRIAKTSVFV